MTPRVWEAFVARCLVDSGVLVQFRELVTPIMLDDTVLVYTSDNGFRLFEHPTLSDKRLMYEESIRVPLLVRYPPLAAAEVFRECTMTWGFANSADCESYAVTLRRKRFQHFLEMVQDGTSPLFNI